MPDPPVVKPEERTSPAEGETYRLKRWGCLAGFQKDLAEEANRQVLLHHHNTLNDVHPGSIYRSSAFLLRELLCEFVPECIGRHFEVRVGLAAFNLTKFPYVTFELSESARLPDDLNQRVVGKVNVPDIPGQPIEAVYTYRTESLDAEIWKTLEGCIERTARTVVRECLIHGANNQESRHRFLSPSTKDDPELSVAWFHALLERAEGQFQNVEKFYHRSDKKLGTHLQLMLFLPTGSVKHATGVFYYPTYRGHPITGDRGRSLRELKQSKAAEESKKLNPSQVLTDTIADLDAVVPQLAKRISKRHGLTKSTESSLYAFLESLMCQSGFAFLAERTKLPAYEDTAETLTDKYAALPQDIDAIWGLYVVYQKWDQHKKEDAARSIENGALAKSFLGQEQVHLAELLRALLPDEKYLDDLRDPARAFNQIYWPWNEWFPKFGLTVYQPDNEGIAGVYASDQLPFRIVTQELEQLLSRTAPEYIQMGILEVAFGVGGGSGPLAVLPLTTKGQTLGALIATRPTAGNSRFSTSDLVSLQCVATWISETIQDAKDNLVFRALSEAASKRHGPAETLHHFCRAAAILTNVRSYRVMPCDPGTRRTGRLPILASPGRGEADEWEFYVPCEVWPPGGADTDFQLFIRYVEPFDIINNYRAKIERLYRTLLFVLGLRGSGTGDPVQVLRDHLAEKPSDAEIKPFARVVNTVANGLEESLVENYIAEHPFADSSFLSALLSCPFTKQDTSELETLAGLTDIVPSSVTMADFLVRVFKRRAQHVRAFDWAIVLGVYAFYDRNSPAVGGYARWTDGRFRERDLPANLFDVLTSK